MRREDWVKFDQWSSFYEVRDGKTTGLSVLDKALVAFDTGILRQVPTNNYTYRHVGEHEFNHIKLALVKRQISRATEGI